MIETTAIGFLLFALVFTCAAVAIDVYVSIREARDVRRWRNDRRAIKRAQIDRLARDDRNREAFAALLEADGCSAERIDELLSR